MKNSFPPLRHAAALLGDVFSRIDMQVTGENFHVEKRNNKKTIATVTTV